MDRRDRQKQELEKWGQEANKEYAGIVRKMNKGRGLLWNVFQTNDINTDCDVLFVGLNPRNGTNMDDVAIRDENGRVKKDWRKQYADDLTHIGGLLGGQWVSQTKLKDEFDEYMRTGNTPEYKEFFRPDWKILKGLRFGDKNSFFREVVRKGSWYLINYYPFGTNDKKDLDTELARLSKDNIQTIRSLNHDLYDILNPKLIIFLGINTLKNVINNDLSVGVCHKEDSMYIGKIHKRDAISICHTSRHWLTDEENQKIAGMLGIEVGNLNIDINSRTIKEGVVDQLKCKGYKFTDDSNPNNPKTTRFKFGDTLTLTVTSAESGYVALRHLNYRGPNYEKSGIDKQEVTDIRAVLSSHAFQTVFKDHDVWLGTKSYCRYIFDIPKYTGEADIVAAILQEIEALEKELGKY